jgi:hypothetical protein
MQNTSQACQALQKQEALLQTLETGSIVANMKEQKAPLQTIIRDGASDKKKKVNGSSN